jgi:dolichyl-phosphate-mannose-protein mannosyltransferase
MSTSRLLRLDARSWRAALSPVGIAVTASIVLGVVFRWVDLGFPDAIKFDEDHFVYNARNYLMNRPDVNNHPPLGKLFQAISIRLLGDTSLAWRVPSAVWGTLTIVVAGLLAKRVFRDSLAGALAAALVAIDGFLLGYSRTAVLDPLLALLFVLSALLLFHAEEERFLWAAAVVIGLTMSTKFTGIVLMPVLFVYLLMHPRPWRRWLAAPLPFVTYFLVFALALYIQGEPDGIRGVWNATLSRYESHAAAKSFAHPYCSQWITWLWGGRGYLHSLVPLEFGGVRASATLGNLVIWAAMSILVVAMISWALGSAAWRRALPRFIWTTDEDWRGAFFILLFWLLPIVPWMFTRRDSFIYHYLPSYVFGVVLCAGALSRLFRARPLAGLFVLVVCMDVSAYYVPVWAERPMSRIAFEHRLFSRSWR